MKIHNLHNEMIFLLCAEWVIDFIFVFIAIWADPTPVHISKRFIVFKTMHVFTMPDWFYKIQQQLTRSSFFVKSYQQIVFLPCHSIRSLREWRRMRIRSISVPLLPSAFSIWEICIFNNFILQQWSTGASKSQGRARIAHPNQTSQRGGFLWQRSDGAAPASISRLNLEFSKLNVSDELSLDWVGVVFSK